MGWVWDPKPTEIWYSHRWKTISTAIITRISSFMFSFYYFASDRNTGCRSDKKCSYLSSYLIGKQLIWSAPRLSYFFCCGKETLNVISLSGDFLVKKYVVRLCPSIRFTSLKSELNRKNVSLEASLNNTAGELVFGHFLTCVCEGIKWTNTGPVLLRAFLCPKT